MSEEVKLNQAPVENAVAELKSSAHAFEATFSEGTEGDNRLDMMEQMNELKQSFNDIGV